MAAGQRAVEPPVPIPNTEVKHSSVLGGSEVFGLAKPRKLAAISFCTNDIDQSRKGYKGEFHL